MQNFKLFIQSEAFCGILLCICTTIALLIANSNYYYIHQFLFDKAFVQLFQVKISGHFLVNDVLMSLFFLQVGIELNHELKHGTLAQKKYALLPLITAIGGVILPALIYLILNHSAHLIRGWAIPTATDIAFAIGIYSLLQHKFNSSLRVILLSIAIIDDILAILIIALFYSKTIAIIPLILAAFIIIIYYALKNKNKYIMTLFFVVLWIAFFKAGIHPTLSGVLIGLLTKQSSQIHEIKFVNYLNKIVTFLIMPLFSFANATIVFNKINLANTEDLKLIIGIMIALIIGKPLGIFGSGFLATRFKWCTLPNGVNLKQLWFISLLSGIGFTMALFTILLSFTREDIIQSAKIGVTFGSLIAAILGLTYGFFLKKE